MCVYLCFYVHVLHVDVCWSVCVYACVSMFLYMRVCMCARFTKAATMPVAPIGSWPMPGTKEGSDVCAIVSAGPQSLYVCVWMYGSAVSPSGNIY